MKKEQEILKVTARGLAKACEDLKTKDSDYEQKENYMNILSILVDDEKTVDFIVDFLTEFVEHGRLEIDYALKLLQVRLQGRLQIL